MLFEPVTGALSEPLTGRHWDAQEIRRKIAARGAHLDGQGLAKGDRVFIHYGNSLEFFVDLMAVWMQGGCAVPIDARLTAFEIETLAKAARPAVALINDATDTSILAVLEAVGAKRVKLEAAPATDPGLRSGRIHLDDPALILFTSGTTGDPKGVVHTHRSLRARWTSLRDSLGKDVYRRTLCMLPTHFGHGLICNALFPWLSGNDLFILPPFRPDFVANLGTLVDTHEITAMSSVPTVWNLALRMARPPQKGTLQRIHCGSAPLTKAMWEQVSDWAGGARVLNTYGITETGSWVAGPVGDDIEPEDGLVGRPFGAVIKITRQTEDETAEPELCATGEAGMIWLNTPALMAGYFERDDLTAKAVRDGWFMTGDIGMLDERGVLYLRGRERDEINKGGMKVYPSDVDGVAIQCPGIADACAFAVADRLYGQDVGLAVVMEGASLDDLKMFLGAKLAKHQMPVRYFVTDDIPRTSRGKINRDHVAKACLGLAT